MNKSFLFATLTNPKIVATGKFGKYQPIARRYCGSPSLPVSENTLEPGNL